MLDLLIKSQNTKYSVPPKIRKKKFLETPSHLTIIRLSLSNNSESLNDEIQCQNRIKIQPILIIKFLEQKIEELF